MMKIPKYYKVQTERNEKLKQSCFDDTLKYARKLAQSNLLQSNIVQKEERGTELKEQQ